MNKENEIIMPVFEEDYYDTSEYISPDFEGVYTGELTYTQWGRKGNKITFVDLADGRKIVVHTWNRETKFFGLIEMAYGAEIEITLKRNSKGRIFLADLKDIEEEIDMEEYLASLDCPTL